METRPFQVCLVCSFCSSDRGFAHREFFIPQSGFLQTPPHDGRPCLRLTVPTAKSVVDSHHQVIMRAEHTQGRLCPFRTTDRRNGRSLFDNGAVIMRPYAVYGFGTGNAASVGQLTPSNSGRSGRAGHSRKADPATIQGEAGRCSVRREAHHAKAASSMMRRLSGIRTVSSDTHAENAAAPMRIRRPGRRTCSS